MNTKKLLVLFVTLGFLWFTPAGAEIHEDVNTLLGEILASQNVSDKSELACGKVTDAQFERLGDAYMELIHPGEAHEVMDQMMGGEGSESLKQIHISMGRSYLGCWPQGGYGGYMMPMMGYYSGNGFGMMSDGYGTPGFSGDGKMMNFGEGGWYGGRGNSALELLWFVFGLIGVVAIIKWFINILKSQK